MIVTEILQVLDHPTWQLGTTHFREAPQIGEIRDRHDARHDRNVDAALMGLVDKAEVGIGVVEVLGDGAIGTGRNLALEVVEIRQRASRLRMDLGIGRDLDAEMPSGFLADEFDQLVGMAQLAKTTGTRRHVTAQRHQALDAGLAVARQHGADVGQAEADAGQMRRSIDLGVVAQLEHGLQGQIARRAAGTEGY